MADDGHTELLGEFPWPGGNTLAGKFFELVHPSFGVLRVQRLNNNAALPKRGTEGAAGYDLCAA